MSKDYKIVPQGKRLLIQLNPVKAFSKEIIKNDGTKGEIVFPDNHSEESRIGIILAKGDEVKGYEVGDKILIAFFSGTVLHFPGEDVLNDTIRMITQSEIMGLIKE